MDMEEDNSFALVVALVVVVVAAVYSVAVAVAAADLVPTMKTNK